jgi:SAM-dependent methyltransferase
MTLNLSGFTDKASRNPEELALYQATDDYVKAYAAHTDLRVRRDGPAAAIGGQWEEHGPLQLAFLRKRGLTPASRLLDLGCGTGRFARVAVPWLDPGRYTGIDISPAALAHARQLGEDEGWAERSPRFIHGTGGFAGLRHRAFDFIWAHSVFTHLPADVIQGLFAGLAVREFGEFAFTYKRHDQPRRSGLKQFQYPPEFFVDAAQAVGLHAEELPDVWPAGQKTMRVWR